MKKQWVRNNSIYRLFLLLTCFFFTFAVLAMAQEETIKEEWHTEQAITQLVNGLEDSGAKVEKVMLNQGTPLPGEKTVEGLFKLGEQITEQIALKDSGQDRANVTWESAGKHPYYQYETWQHGVKTTVRLVGTEWNDQWKPYLIIRMEGAYQSLPEVKRSIVGISENMKQLGIEPNFNACLQGYYDDTLKVSAQEKMIDGYLHKYNASVVEKMQDQAVLSISAYSPHISGSIITNDMKMNLQVATHVDHTSETTKITVGTPIITTTY